MSDSGLNRQLDNKKSEITFFALKAIQNYIEKNQEPGDATKVDKAGKTDIIDVAIPELVIDAKADTYKVQLDKDERKATRNKNGKTIDIDVKDVIRQHEYHVKNNKARKDRIKNEQDKGMTH